MGEPDEVFLMIANSEISVCRLIKSFLRPSFHLADPGLGGRTDGRPVPGVGTSRLQPDSENKGVLVFLKASL